MTCQNSKIGMSIAGLKCSKMFTVDGTDMTVSQEDKEPSLVDPAGVNMKV